MIVLDDRERQADELSTALRRLDIESTTARLEFGDCAFTGNGPDGGCAVGIERKRLSDLVNSMKDRRLSGHQLRGMWREYDYVFLVTEGEWRPGPGGEIEELTTYWCAAEKKRKLGWRPFYSNGVVSERVAISYAQVMGYITGLELRGGVVWRKTRDLRETAAQYASLWHNFNDKLWSEHHSHDQVYCNGVGGRLMPYKGHGADWGRDHGHDEEYDPPGGRGRAMISQENPTTLWRMAAQLPGVDRRAEAVARHFQTVRAMANATEAQWMEVDCGVTAKGRKAPGFGEVTARAVVRAITEPGA